jgi:hypothetical protein
MVVTVPPGCDRREQPWVAVAGEPAQPSQGQAVALRVGVTDPVEEVHGSQEREGGTVHLGLISAQMAYVAV